jgi:RimJ/RimL family protein N-acetyltransferase
MTGMVVLITERLVLREMTGADLDLIAALFGDEEVMTATPGPGRRRHARDPDGQLVARRGPSRRAGPGRGPAG